jgi:hypothetical protein
METRAPGAGDPGSSAGPATICREEGTRSTARTGMSGRSMWLGLELGVRITMPFSVTDNDKVSLNPVNTTFAKIDRIHVGFIDLAEPNRLIGCR